MSVNSDEFNVNNDGSAIRHDDLTLLDDSALLSRRAQMRAELERLPPSSPAYAALAALYDRSTAVVNDRARRAWTRAD